MTRNGRSPSEIVASAYRAANRGRYGQADRYLTAGFRKQRHAITDMRAANQKLAATLPCVRSPRERAKLAKLLVTLRQFEDPHYLWKGSTQGRSISSIDVIRETIRPGQALVTVALQLSDGRTRIERNRLVRSNGRWAIRATEVLENNEMQLTRSAMAR